MSSRTSEQNNFKLCLVSYHDCFLTDEYEAYIKKQEETFKTEVTTVVQEPKEGDVPPVVMTTMEKITTTIISGQVRSL